ncbi:MAG: DUF4340 domain-containing protein [Clostridia bacterium]
MKNATKYIIITLVALLVLGGGIAALVITTPEVVIEEAESTVDVVEADVIIDKEITDLETTYIVNPLNEMTVERVPADETQISDTYVLVGYEQYSLMTEAGTGIEALLPLTATKTIGEVQNLSEYGLDNEGETVYLTLEFTDGSAIEIAIGSLGAETTGRYILCDGIVYIATVDDFFQSNKERYVQGYSYSEYQMDSTGETVESTLQYIEFSGTNYPLSVRIEDSALSDAMVDYAMQDFIMTEPFGREVDANIDKLAEVVTALQENTIGGIAVLNATEEDLEAYGLLEPMTIIEFSINDTVRTFAASSMVTSDGFRYMYIDGDTTTIYSMLIDYSDIWATTTITDLRSNYMFITGINDVETLTVDYSGNEELVVEFEREVDEENSTDTYTKYTYTTTANGKNVTYQDVTTTFYTSLLSIACQNVVEKECEEEASLTITYEYYDGGSDTIAYHLSEDGDYMAYLDGEFIGTARSSSIETDYPAAFRIYEAEFEE